MQNPGTRGNRKPSSKRKFPGGNAETAGDLPPNSQGTLPDLFSRERSNLVSQRNRPSSPTSKRPKLNAFDDQLPPRDPQASQTRIPVERMYSFSNTNQNNPATSIQNNHSSPSPALQTYPSSSSTPTNFTPHAGPKRLTVKNLRTGQKLDHEQYFEKTWAQLDAALDAIFNEQTPPYALEELYKGVENVCRQKRAQNLAKRLQDRCRAYICDSVVPALLKKTESNDEIDTLRAVEGAWSAWSSRLVSYQGT